MRAEPVGCLWLDNGPGVSQIEDIHDLEQAPTRKHDRIVVLVHKYARGSGVKFTLLMAAGKGTAYFFAKFEQLKLAGSVVSQRQSCDNSNDGLAFEGCRTFCLFLNPCPNKDVAVSASVLVKIPQLDKVVK